MNTIPDLTPEERKECLEEYVRVYIHSRRGPADLLHLRISLKSLGLDASEVEEVIVSIGG